MVLELLLARTPKAELIRKLAAAHGVTESRFKSEDPEELCILCGLCVRTCRDIVGVSAISMANRTPDKQVATPFKEQSEACIGCGSCAFICPTNVIPYTEKNGVRTIWGRELRTGGLRNLWQLHRSPGLPGILGQADRRPRRTLLHLPQLPVSRTSLSN